jgi:hypothetical protein
VIGGQRRRSGVGLVRQREVDGVGQGGGVSAPGGVCVALVVSGDAPGRDQRIAGPGVAQDQLARVGEELVDRVRGHHVCPDNDLRRDLSRRPSL